MENPTTNVKLKDYLARRVTSGAARNRRLVQSMNAGADFSGLKKSLEEEEYFKPAMSRVTSPKNQERVFSAENIRARYRN